MKIKTLLPIIAATLVLAACGPKNPSDPDTPTQPDTPVEPEVGPVDGETYKFGFYHKGLGGHYYITGNFVSYYGEITNSYSSGVDVTAHEVTGGWKLSFDQSGTTKYIGFEVADHINITYSSTNQTVWEYDEEYDTFLCDYNGKTYFLGALGSKTYNNIACYYKNEYFDTDCHATLYTAAGVTIGSASTGGGTGGSSSEDNIYYQCLVEFAAALEAEIEIESETCAYFMVAYYASEFDSLAAAVDYVAEFAPSTFVVSTQTYGITYDDGTEGALMELDANNGQIWVDIYDWYSTEGADEIIVICVEAYQPE